MHPFPLNALMSRNPWPDRLNRMTVSRPAFLAARASSMTAAMACEDSGAGRIPSVFKKRVAASKTLSWD